MSDKPILFSGPMVRAILEGRKTQTRRVVTGMALEWLRPDGFTPQFVADPENYLSRYGYRGDMLWVRETWATSPFQHGGIKPSDLKRNEASIIYRADIPDEDSRQSHYVWRPSIFMVRWMSRITLEVINVRVERLQDISEEDARAEGVVWQRDFGNGPETREARPVFFDVWDAINGNRDEGAYTVEKNPWVWVIEFKRMEGVDARA